MFLVLSLLSSLGIAVMLRIAEDRRRDRVIIIASNYVAAAVLGSALSSRTTAPMGVYALGLILGLFFVVGFMMLSRAIKTAGLASAVTVGRLSLAVPVLLSIFIWGESPLWADITGLSLIFFIILCWEGRIGKVSPLLLLLFSIFGLLDAALKYFKLTFPRTDDGFFLTILFFSAVLWSWSYILFSRRKPGKTDMLFGVLLGIPNFFSSFFVLKALEEIPAYVAFPFINIGIIILSALSGYLFFRERLSPYRIGLMGLGIVSVFLLTV